MTSEEWNEATKDQVFEGCEANDPSCLTCRSKARSKIADRNWELIRKKIARQEWFRPFQSPVAGYPKECWSNLTMKDITLEWKSNGEFGEMISNVIMGALVLLGVGIVGISAIAVIKFWSDLLKAIF